MATIESSIRIHDIMSQQFRAINLAMSTVIDSFYTLQDASNDAIDISAIESAQRELWQVEASFKQIENEIQQAERAQESFNKDIQRADDYAKKLLGTIGGILGAYLTIQGLEEVIQISDDYINSTARVSLLVDDIPLSNSIDYISQMIEKLNAEIAFNATIDATKVQQELKAIEEEILSVNVQTDGAELAELSSQLSQIRTELGIDVTFNGMSELELAQQMIFDAAQRSYSSFKDMSDMVSRIGSNARDAFSSLDEAVVFSELVQKQFAIAGASAIEANNATIQLSQALASGVLRGDELNSIFEQAPNLILTIADYMEVPIGKIRELAAEGEITADIVKNAMFAASDDINAKFESMPVTWSQIWISFQNAALWAFRPVLELINDIANSERLQDFMNKASTSMETLSTITLHTLNLMTNMGAFIYDNWSLIAPVVGIATAAIVAYGSALMIAKAATMVSTFWTGAKILALGLMTANSWAGVQATISLTAAQWGLNAAMMANPVFLVVLAIIALIGVIYLAVAAVNHFTGSSYSATGLIAGFFATLGAFIANVFMGLLEIVLGIIEVFYNRWVAFANFFGNVFNDPIGAIIHLFGDLADNVLGVIEKIAKAIDFVFGANLASTVAGWRSELSSLVNWAAEEYGNGQYEVLYEELDMDQLMSEFGISLKRFEYSSARNTGYNWGSNLFSGFDISTFDYTHNYDDILGSFGNIQDALDVGNLAAADTAGNTGKLADTVDLLEEDLKYLRDMAERESINRYTIAEIKVDMKNENYIKSEADIDGIIDRFGEKVEECIENLAEGDDEFV